MLNYICEKCGNTWKRTEDFANLIDKKDEERCRVCGTFVVPESVSEDEW